MRKVTQWQVSLHYHSSRMKENKEDPHISFKERSILKRTFQHTTGFCRFGEEERRRLSIGYNFLQQLRRSGVSRVRGEKVAAARTEKLGTHTHRTTAIPSLLACDGEGNN